MHTLSDKKYIQTKARSLPVYKCLVGKDWEETQITSVIVMRKHTNGNITAGVYHIDLLCLGVKATSFFFNVEEKIIHDYTSNHPHEYEEIEYALAHNIIFAGHDFAMDFDIHPHKDFEITRHILEEDNDDISLIEIPVGKKGIPHLVVLRTTDRPDALAKLKKNAGEGNYYYSVAEEEDFDEYFLENYPPGTVNCQNVQNIETEDLQNEEQVQQRDLMERTYIEAELYTRLLPEEYTYIEPEIEKEWEKKWTATFSDLPAGMTPQQFDEYQEAMDELLDKKYAGSGGAQGKLHLEDRSIDLANRYATNPLLIATFYESSLIMGMNRLETAAKVHAEKIAPHSPMLQISLALVARIQGKTNSYLDTVYSTDNFLDFIPGHTTFHASEFINFALVKMCKCIDEGEIEFAVKFYNLIANSGGTKASLLPIVWGSYTAELKEIVNGEEDDEE
ncbi:MAG: hypothetical protein DI538_06210 [Azospira oryzae]|nr:MAG: hypothetical protein DI538_06210 [Azospira oryzae]